MMWFNEFGASHSHSGAGGSATPDNPNIVRVWGFSQVDEQRSRHIDAIVEKLRNKNKPVELERAA